MTTHYSREAEKALLVLKSNQSFSCSIPEPTGSCPESQHGTEGWRLPFTVSIYPAFWCTDSLAACSEDWSDYCNLHGKLFQRNSLQAVITHSSDSKKKKKKALKELLIKKNKIKCFQRCSSNKILSLLNHTNKFKRESCIRGNVENFSVI